MLSDIFTEMYKGVKSTVSISNNTTVTPLVIQFKFKLKVEFPDIANKVIIVTWSFS